MGGIHAGGREPFPSFADVFYLAGYPLVATGLVVGIRWRTPRTDVRVLIDAAIVTVTAVTIGWVYIAETWDAESSLFDALVASAYPGADVLLCVSRPARCSAGAGGTCGRCSCWSSQ